MKSPLEIRKRKKYHIAQMPTLSGVEYMEWGGSLMLIKFGMDAIVSTYMFHRPWSFWNYFAPPILNGAPALASADLWFYAGMLTIALPFAFVGSILTLRRLNTLKLPPWLVILFYTPFINMIFFCILSVVKSAPTKSDPAVHPALLPPTPQSTGLIETDQSAPLIAAPKDSEAKTKDAEANKSIAEAKDAETNKSNAEANKSNTEADKIAPQQPIAALSNQQKPLPGERAAIAFVNKNIPVDSPRAFIIAALLPVPISVLAAMFSVTILGVYGWSVFTAVPFVAAIASPILYGWHKQRGILECIYSSVCCLFLMASCLLIIPFEGIICLAMATPLALGIGLIGGLVGYAIQASLPRNESTPRLLSCFALFLPLLAIGEFISPVQYPTYENVSKIEINAPPNLVWKYLINFPRLKEPTEPIFKTGIAYPIEAKISGRGPGAIRECIFTTGKFVEPIEIWDEGKLLRFGVLEQAPPMREMSLYPKLHPPHLDHYLIAKQGQFRLKEPTPNHTVLYGSTWYQNCMGPGAYWRIWSDWIIHSIHMRVLNHVKTLAETDYNAHR